MKTLCTILLFFSVSITFSQENQITESNLIGSWTFDRTVKGVDYNIMIYKRSNSNQPGSVVTFFDNGEFSLDHNWGHRRCGNETQPRTIKGNFHLNSESRELSLTGTSFSYHQSWQLLWLDNNSFGLKRIVPGPVYN